MWSELHAPHPPTTAPGQLSNAIKSLRPRGIGHTADPPPAQSPQRESLWQQNPAHYMILPSARCPTSPPPCLPALALPTEATDRTEPRAFHHLPPLRASDALRAHASPGGASITYSPTSAR
ncbi:hypothetical protein AAFF_G00408150 [Aldrovandia affinis]|uniref:Uncharacterized protein n=1 Tax=Aldrovandia affinis TaxID=143900 RepID=A0AAD7SBT2_9TELE|nr:hypothetical protein AAFF_G00408150 [Aldrovandia affinis]